MVARDQRMSKTPATTPYLTVDSWLSHLAKSGDEPSVSSAKQTAVHLMDETKSELKACSVYDCFGCEVGFNGNTYVLSSGTWYEVVPEFLSRINKAVAKIGSPAITLPAWNQIESEGEYNARCAKGSAELATDLKGDRFQEYLLEEAFKKLVASASVRLKTISNRYTLQWDSGEFYVVDHDNAGERRRAETLSGGETFMASLCLALQLSDEVLRTSGALQMDSLFIDEGFGTLDSDSLSEVTDAMEALRQDGDRMIGVISHRPELTEKLPGCIHVEKGTGESHYRKHWPEIDNLSPVKDQTLVIQLDNQLDTEFGDGSSRAMVLRSWSSRLFCARWDEPEIFAVQQTSSSHTTGFPSTGGNSLCGTTGQQSTAFRLNRRSSTPPRRRDGGGDSESSGAAPKPLDLSLGTRERPKESFDFRHQVDVVKRRASARDRVLEALCYRSSVSCVAWRARRSIGESESAKLIRAESVGRERLRLGTSFAKSPAGL